ncbi:MAG: hypothetical protein J0I20_35705 [Chloroflexi bacterium]|nr:hypothetical protein [Chloroflexota bacterium]
MANDKKTRVVLDFDAFVRVEDTVKIEGVEHPFLSAEIYGPEIQAEFLNRRNLLTKYRENPTKDNLEALNKTQDDFLRVIVPSLKDYPVDKLPDMFKEQVITYFFGQVEAVDYRTPEQKERDRAAQEALKAKPNQPNQ